MRSWLNGQVLGAKNPNFFCEVHTQNISWFKIVPFAFVHLQNLQDDAGICKEAYHRHCADGGRHNGHRVVVPQPRQSKIITKLFARNQQHASRFSVNPQNWQTDQKKKKKKKSLWPAWKRKSSCDASQNELKKEPHPPPKQLWKKRFSSAMQQLSQIRLYRFTNFWHVSTLPLFSGWHDFYACVQIWQIPNVLACKSYRLTQWFNGKRSGMIIMPSALAGFLARIGERLKTTAPTGFQKRKNREVFIINSTAFTDQIDCRFHILLRP